MHRRPWIPLLLLWTAALLWSCGDDDGPTGGGRDARIILIPLDMTLEEAADSAVAGDTLVFSGPFQLPIEETVVFAGNQTPIVLRGSKDFPTVSGAVDPVMRFENPQAGTRIEELGFAGGGTLLEVRGGRIELATVSFAGGALQLAALDGARVTLREAIFRDATGDAVALAAGGVLDALGVTVARAGGDGFDLAASSQALITNSILWQTTGYGFRCADSTVLAPDSGCNDFFANTAGARLNCAPGEHDFSLDPLFCADERNDFTLQSNSPCGPSFNTECGLIGAFPVGCDPDTLGLPLGRFSGGASGPRTP